MKKILFFIFLAFYVPTFAQVPEGSPSKFIYLQLLEDFYSEMRTMDAVHEPMSEREAAILSMKRAMLGTHPNQFTFEKESSWSWAWPVKKENSIASQRATFEKFRAARASVPGDRHSIQNFDGYVEARIGSLSAQLIRQGRVQAVVVGGSEKSLPAFFQIPESDIYKLPSLYESWGLKRYFVPAEAMPDHVARLVYVVPPSTEYLDHYNLMLSSLTKTETQVYRSQQDYDQWKMELARGAQELGNQLGGKFDYVALGYYNQWREVLAKNYEILEAKEDILPSGHMGRYYLAKHKTENFQVRLLTLGHQKTIWGEASAHLIEGTLAFHPRGVIFMGSAGSISDELRVYDISAPQAFRTKQAAVDIQNFIKASAAADLKQSGLDPIQIHFQSIHGNTSSPAAQTMSYLEKHVKNGESTIDVEQSLIAEAVANYNKSHKQKVQFGAVNLITDQPMGHANHDLDRIDPAKKANARLASVTLALQAIAKEIQRPRDCRMVHQ